MPDQYYSNHVRIGRKNRVKAHNQEVVGEMVRMSVVGWRDT